MSWLDKSALTYVLNVNCLNVQLKEKGERKADKDKGIQALCFPTGR